MTIFNTFFVLFIICRSAQSFYYSCDEIQYKLINSDVELSPRNVCLFAGESFSDYDSLKKIYLQAGDTKTSFDDLLNVMCMENPSDVPWRIVGDFQVDCEAMEEDISLIFANILPPINVVSHINYSNRTATISGGEQLFVNPMTLDQTCLYPKECTGSGNVTFFTGVGSGPEEQRFYMKSWSCADLPSMIFTFDPVITVAVDAGTKLVVMYRFGAGEPVVQPGDKMVIMASGRSDDVRSKNYPGGNHVYFLVANTEMMATATCSPCTFDPKNEGYLSVITYHDVAWNHDLEMNISAEGTYNFLLPYFNEDEYFSVSIVDYLTKWVAPQDIGESEDNFVLEISFSEYTEQTTSTPSAVAGSYCGCELDQKFGMPDGWDSTKIWLDIVIILDTSEAMGDVALTDASSLIESFIGTEGEDVLTTDTRAEFYTRIGLIAMSDTAEVLYNLNMTKWDKVSDKAHIKKGVADINVVDAFNVALTMFNNGLKADRVNTRQVIYYMTDSDPITNLAPLNQFKASQGIIIVNNFIENGEIARSGLKDLASDGYYSASIQENYMETIQLFCKANCFCSATRDAYDGGSADPAVQAAGGCFHVAPVGIPFSKARSNCDSLGGGLVSSIHDPNKAEFLQKLMAKAAPSSDYFWIGLSKSDSGWAWEDQSTNPYTNWDADEPSPAAVAKCAYVDAASLFWGAGNCNVGFPSACEFAPCSVGIKNC